MSGSGSEKMILSCSALPSRMLYTHCREGGGGGGGGGEGERGREGQRERERERGGGGLKQRVVSE